MLDEHADLYMNMRSGIMAAVYSASGDDRAACRSLVRWPWTQSSRRSACRPSGLLFADEPGAGPATESEAGLRPCGRIANYATLGLHRPAPPPRPQFTNGSTGG